MKRQFSLNQQCHCGLEARVFDDGFVLNFIIINMVGTLVIAVIHNVERNIFSCTCMTQGRYIKQVTRVTSPLDIIARAGSRTLRS